MYGLEGKNKTIIICQLYNYKNSVDQCLELIREILTKPSSSYKNQHYYTGNNKNKG